MQKKLHVISHTHWDREWYQTFQGYRKRLVAVIDELIEQMEKDERFRFFHLDGQTIVLEDYLRIKPENEKRLRKLIEAGRLIIGPWYVMPDGFLVSGESLVRNLLKGHEICSEYNVEPMKNGYLTDVFGINSQLPQILKGFNIEAATFYRGIGDYPKAEFLWEGPDKSGIVVLKLDEERSYSNFYFTVEWPFEGREYEPAEIKERMQGLLRFMEPKANTRHYLMMDGVDHFGMEPRLPWLLDIISEIDGIEILHTTMDQYYSELKKDLPALEVIKGELRDPAYRGINNRVTKDVLSSMVHLKQMNNDCERLLAGWTEPFSCFREMLGLGEYQKGFLKEAWRNLLMNHPHDSICGCSITDVHKDNEYRFNQVRYIGTEILEENIKDICKNIDTSVFKEGYAITLFNSNQNDYEGIVTVDIEIPGKLEYEWDIKKPANILLLDKNGNVVPYQLLEIRKNRMKRVNEYRKAPKWDVNDVYSIAFEASVPALGYTCYNYQLKNIKWPQHGDFTYREFYPAIRYQGTMQTDYNEWDNGILKIGINSNGTLKITDKETGRYYDQLHHFQDGGDVGDGWEYKYPLRDRIVTSLSGNAQVSIENNGLFMARLCIDTYLNLPESAENDDYSRSSKDKVFAVKTYVEIRKNSRTIGFTSMIDNNISDHRLRVLFPSHMDTEVYYTATPFDLYERPVKNPDFSSNFEEDTRVAPNQGVVILRDKQASFGIFNKGLYEVEALDDRSRTVALTLFRSFHKEFGQNRGQMSFLHRSLKFEYAVYIGTGKESNGDLVINSTKFRDGIKVWCDVLHKGTLPLYGSCLKIDMPGAVLSCFKKSEKNDAYVLRLFNCEKFGVTGSIHLGEPIKELYRMDLKENTCERLDITKLCNISLSPKEIVTLKIVK